MGSSVSSLCSLFDWGPIEAASVGRREPIGPVNLLHNSSLKQVLLVLQYYAALCHEYRVRAHIVKVLRARGDRSRLLGVLTVDSSMATLRPRWELSNERAAVAVLLPYLWEHYTALHPLCGVLFLELSLVSHGLSFGNVHVSHL